MNAKVSLCDRRRSRVLLATSLLLGLVTTTGAESSPSKTATPGYHRMILGPVEVTALSDGSFAMDRTVLRGATADEIDRLLARSSITGPKMPSSVNAFLVKTGGRLVLVDAGAGRAYGPTLGRVVENLKAAGYRPEQVDTVLLTHLHGDHVGGLLDAEGKATFPKATVYVPKADHERWVAAQGEASAEAHEQRATDLARRTAAQYAPRGKWKAIADGDRPAPGVKAMALVGHTPGHTVYEVRGDGQTLLIWGDTMHSMAVQFANPDVAVQFDADPRQAVAARKRLLAKLAADGTWVAGAHLAFPGIGKIRVNPAGGYTWVPVEASPAP